MYLYLNLDQKHIHKVDYLIYLFDLLGQNHNFSNFSYASVIVLGMQCCLVSHNSTSD